MFARWVRQLTWRPFSLTCRRFPLVPLRAAVSEPVDGVTCIRIGNVVTRLLSRFAGGYDYAVCYLVDDTLLIDAGFPWARNALRQTLVALGAERSITTVVNTHYHEDHTGNNDLLVELCGPRVSAHRVAVPEIRFPPELPGIVTSCSDQETHAFSSITRRQHPRRPRPFHAHRTETPDAARSSAPGSRSTPGRSRCATGCRAPPPHTDRR